MPGGTSGLSEEFEATWVLEARMGLLKHKLHNKRRIFVKIIALEVSL